MNVLRCFYIGIVASALCNLSLCGQTNQPAGETVRPFQVMVEVLSTRPLRQQYEYILRINHGLMREDYAAVTGQRDLPHFGHLARELMLQENYDLMRELLRRRELDPYNYFVIADLLAKKLDAGTFAILMTNSSPSMSDPTEDTGYKSGEDHIAGEGIPDYSALSLRYYLQGDSYGTKAQAHLIKILKEHRRTGVRAFAAKALGDAVGGEAEKALRDAAKDRSRVPTDQGQFDYVSEYAQEALQKIANRIK